MADPITNMVVVLGKVYESSKTTLVAATEEGGISGAVKGAALGAGAVGTYAGGAALAGGPLGWTSGLTAAGVAGALGFVVGLIPKKGWLEKMEA